ncbi:Uu.00g028650.m01.CDS01 [Anthostomella pinea]|uniref:Uu.00g028650.m01.CDS01 n=1 Tax=Anthostomella pinea TaxID=933095 RepID=A0AAI8YCU0_9PEZI|nr:Uu.00g028650.m01.CDS01 [Anthostomella pinea]
MTCHAPPPDLIRGSLASGEGILSVGLPRTGSLSMAMALNTLGYSHVHHIMKFVSDDEFRKWGMAAHDHFPYLQGRDGKARPWPKERWDSWFGQYQGVTDAAGFLAPELIKTYPNAKVVLVVRPFDKWKKSIEDTLLKGVFGPLPAIWQHVLEPLGPTPNTMWGLRSLLSGWLEANSLAEARARCRHKYDEHHRVVRALVRPQQLLEYKMGDGWEPLARFLEKDTPDVPFPHVNETAGVNRRFTLGFLRSIRIALLTVLRVVMPLVYIWLGYRLAKREVTPMAVFSGLRLNLW